MTILRNFRFISVYKMQLTLLQSDVRLTLLLSIITATGAALRCNQK